jgi:hypothetical protein
MFTERCVTWYCLSRALSTLPLSVPPPHTHLKLKILTHRYRDYRSCLYFPQIRLLSVSLAVKWLLATRYILECSCFLNMCCLRLECRRLWSVGVWMARKYQFQNSRTRLTQRRWSSMWHWGRFARCPRQIKMKCLSPEMITQSFTPVRYVYYNECVFRSGAASFSSDVTPCGLVHSCGRYGGTYCQQIHVRPNKSRFYGNTVIHLPICTMTDTVRLVFSFKFSS